MNIKVLFAIIYTKHNIQCKNCNINYKKQTNIQIRDYKNPLVRFIVLYTTGNVHKWLLSRTYNFVPLN